MEEQIKLPPIDSGYAYISSIKIAVKETNISNTQIHRLLNGHISRNTKFTFIYA